jgi:exodeoxyribonuclease V alpha subunit
MAQTLEGTLERITYCNEENGYTIARFALPDGALCTIVGNMVGVNAGEALRLAGEWIAHPEYGRQFKVESYATVLPATIEGIRKYLGSGLIKGVGPVTAQRIVKKFGPDTLRVIDEDPDRLHEVLGVGPRRINLIKAAWIEQKKIKEVMLFLQSHDVSASLAVKIYKQYGDASLDVVRRDPYRLARDIFGIGFITADRIARKLGLPHDAPQRIQAGVAYALSQMADAGHVFAPQGELLREAAGMLEVEPAQATEALTVLEQDGRVKREQLAPAAGYAAGGLSAGRTPAAPAVAEEPAVYLTPFYHGEVGVAGRLHDLLRAPQRALPFSDADNWPALLGAAARQDGVTLNAEQAAGVRAALTHKVAVLTGGPGTGKTTTVRAILRLAQMRGAEVALAAPTGRAAKRLTELTGQEARTIHRLLEFSPQAGSRFLRDEDNPLDADLIIVDEASMLDLLLTYHLLRAIPPRAHLLLVGDIDQLPSVGAGNVLRDIIASGQAAVTRLQQIYRQASHSWIIENAHRIQRGEPPLFPKDASDFFLFPTEDAARAAELIVEIVTQRIPARFGFDPLGDIQVLCPMHRGPAGVASINEKLQDALNPAGPRKAERRAGPTLFRAGDRVMQIRNNYDKEVFNGDIGILERIDLEDQAAIVRVDGRPATYDFSELDDLTLAYAISIHKSQGSEYPAVVIPLLTQHYMMLQRNLLYTAATRARKLVVLVGSARAIGMAVRNAQTATRHTGLTQRLQEEQEEMGRG